MGRAGALAAMLTVAVSVTGLGVRVRPASADATFAQRMLELVNQERTADKLGPVVADARLAAVAEGAPYSGCGFPVSGRAVDMGERNYFSHSIAGCGQGVSQMLNASGLVYSGVGENIAYASGLTDPLTAAANLHASLMNSPEHRANILNPAYTTVGIGSWHTAPGQTWSGGGYPFTNVYIVAEIFTGPLAPPTDPGGVYHPVTPTRILDTRTGTGAPAGPLGQGAIMNLQVAGRGGVPASGVSAVVVNVTVTGPTAPSYLTVFPAGEALPLAANLTFVTGQTVPNLVTAKLGAGGQVSIYNAGGTTHVVADLAGWYDSGLLGLVGARYHPVTPARILDTRTGTGAPPAPLGQAATMNLQVAGRAGVPILGASAVVMNVTVTGPTAPSFLTVFPAGEALPLAANLNFVAGQTVPNLVAAKLGLTGQVSVYNAGGSTDVIADIAGWYDSGVPNLLDPGSVYHPLTPTRILDTRTGNGAPAGALGAAATMTLQVTGRGGVPLTGATAAVMNVTVTGPSAASFLTVFPAGEPLPLAANLNFVADQTVPNLVATKLGTGGQASVYNAAGSTHLVVDLAGWYGPG